jgi:hypothetical protein
MRTHPDIRGFETAEAISDLIDVTDLTYPTASARTPA